MIRGAFDGFEAGPAEVTRRARLASPTVAVLLGVLTLVLVVVDIPLEAAIHTLAASSALILVFLLPFAAVGTVVARRQPDNPMGWLLLAVALIEVVAADASDYTVFVYHYGHRAWPLGPVAVVLDLGFVAGLVVMPLVVLLFPDGRLGTRWRWALRMYLVLFGVFLAGLLSVAAVALGHRIPVDGSGNVLGRNHPAGFAAWFGVAQTVTKPLFVTFCLASVVHQALSYRGSSGLRRQQLKWLGAGGTICVAGLLFVVSGAIASAPTIVWVLVIAGWAALPASIGVGILRYRLYEIDRLVSRTLSYAILTALLAGTFIGLIALTTNTLALSSRVGVAASTLAAAALFNPLRIRIQRLVDRRFNRARYDAEAIVSAFTTRLRDAVEIDGIRADLLDTVNHAFQPTHASVWIKPQPVD